MVGFFGKLFGGPSEQPDPAERVEYNGYIITPTPIKVGDQYRLSSVIAKVDAVDGPAHHLIRADTCFNRDEAVTLSIAKAKRMIDEQGENLPLNA